MARLEQNFTTVLALYLIAAGYNGYDKITRFEACKAMHTTNDDGSTFGKIYSF